MSDLGPDLREAGDHGDSTVLRHVLSLLAADDLSDAQALEFGVGGGGSLALIADVLPVIGFDAFSGLPADWRPGFEAGMFAQNKIPQIENATVVVGLFDDVLPFYDWTDARIALVHLDADLYDSTLCALRNCGHLIQSGTYVVLDEFHGYDDDFSGEVPGEQRAWSEWAMAENIAVEIIGHGREQVAFRVLGRGVVVNA